MAAATVILFGLLAWAAAVSAGPLVYEPNDCSPVVQDCLAVALEAESEAPLGADKASIGRLAFEECLGQ